MELEIHRTTPDALIEAVRGVPNQVVVCQFKSSPTAHDLQVMAATLSQASVPPEAVAIRTIRYEPTITDSTALSLDALAMHTDGSFLAEPPRQFILSCLKADEGSGGFSTLVPVSRIVACAPEWVLSTLSTATYRFLMKYNGDMANSFSAPVLSQGPDGATSIRWRGDHIYRPVPVRGDDITAAEAVEWLYKFLDSCEPGTYALRAGELMVVPNWLFVHGRQALSPGSSREIMRAWIF
jgi:hypothetical protein